MRLVNILEENVKGFHTKNDKFKIQLIRYLKSALIAFIADFGILFFLTEIISLFYLVSATLSFICGVCIMYYLSINWIFSNRKVKNKPLEFSIFLITCIIGLFLNILIIWFFTEHLHIYYLYSKIFSTLTVFFWNFFSKKFILFK